MRFHDRRRRGGSWPCSSRRGERPPARRRPRPCARGWPRATFAGGCFWCMEPPFEKLHGVVSVTSGTPAAPEKNDLRQGIEPRHRSRGGGRDRLRPKVSATASARGLLAQNRPTTESQFCDSGGQYRTGIFVHDAEQRRLARKSKRAIERTRKFAGTGPHHIEGAACLRAEDITRTSTRKARSGTTPTAPDAGVTAVSRSCGATTRGTNEGIAPGGGSAILPSCLVVALAFELHL